jgi:hypothetical protein
VAQNRQTQRHEVNLAGTARIGDDTQPVVIRNISLGGAFLETKARLAMETHLELSFRVPTQEQPLSVSGRVRWSTEDGAGVQFDGLRAREVWSLNKFFEQLSHRRSS